MALPTVKSGNPKNIKLSILTAIAGLSVMISSSAVADHPKGCGSVARWQFENAAKTAVAETNGFGFGLPMWVTMVDESGLVCHVYSTDGSSGNSGYDAGNDAWLGSRVISAQKANTANAFSLNGLAISTGAISVAVYPGGSLYGLQHSNPVDASRSYQGDPNNYGKNSDPLKGKRIGGVNVFGGGVALYNAYGTKVGGLGASGDTSCRDHAVAYRMRIALGLNNQPNDDGLKLVAAPAALFEQPACGVADPTTSTNNSGASDFGVR